MEPKGECGVGVRVQCGLGACACDNVHVCARMRGLVQEPCV